MRFMCGRLAVAEDVTGDGGVDGLLAAIVFGDGPSDGWGRMGGREHGWRHHRGERADWGRGGGNDRDRFDGEGRRDGKHGGRMMRIIDANGDGVIGDDEAAAGEVSLKPLRSGGEQIRIPMEILPETLADRLLESEQDDGSI